MAKTVGDLYPRASGQANLGVEQNVGLGSFTTDIRPFGHIHQNSGVFHDALLGESGVMRYTRQHPAFEISVDGGKTFGILPTSGQIDESIRETAPTIVLSGIMDTVVVRDDTGSNINASASDNLISWDGESVKKGASITHSNVTNNSRMTIHASGTYYSDVRIVFEPNGVSHYRGEVKIRKNGSVVLPHRGVNIWDNGGFPIGIDASDNMALSFVLDLDVGDYLEVLVDRLSGTNLASIKAGDSVWSVTRLAVGEVLDNPFIDLQAAYDNGRRIVQTTSVGDMEIWSAENQKLTLVGTDEIAPVNFSGVQQAGVGVQALGDLAMLTHTFTQTDVGLTQAETQARSLGPGTLGLDTGSGIVSLVVSSGIQRFKKTDAGQTLAAFTSYTPINFSQEQFEHDDFYAWDSSVTGVRIFVPGLYQVIANLLVTTSATTTIYSRVAVNGTSVQATDSAGPCLTGDFRTLETNIFVNLNAGDYVQVEASKAAGTATASQNNCALHLRYIGPPRGQTG